VFTYLKRGWMAFAHRVGLIQTAILLSLAYVLVIGPTSIILRVLGRRDLLDLHRKRATSYAHPKRAIPTDRERCERQF
jgi:hypothetical protein